MPRPCTQVVTKEIIQAGQTFLVFYKMPGETLGAQYTIRVPVRRAEPFSEYPVLFN